MQRDLGKTASDPSFKVVDLATPEKFKEVLLWDISTYSGHDEIKYYISSAATPKGLPRTRVYAIGVGKVSKEWLKKVLEEKKERRERSERERKANSRPVPQVPLIKEWLEWQERTNLVHEPEG